MNNRRNVRNVRVPRPVYGRPPASRNRRPTRRRVFKLGTLPKRVVIIFVIILALALGLKQLFTIKQINVASQARNSEVTREVQQLIDGNLMQSNLITLNSSQLVSKLLAADPMIKTASVVRNWPASISVKVTLKRPSLGWTTGNQSYLLDRDGTVIGALPVGQALPVVIDNSNLPVALGQRVTSTQFVGFTIDANDAMTRLKLGPTKLEIKDTTLDLYATTPAGYQLIFDTSRAAADEVSDLKEILQALSSQKKSVTQYIDLRVVGKAYYK